MNADEIRYTLLKQAVTMTGIETNYGTIPLDFENDYELWEAVQDALTRVLGERLKKLEGVK